MDHKSSFIQSFDSPLLILRAKTPLFDIDDRCWWQKCWRLLWYWWQIGPRYEIVINIIVTKIEIVSLILSPCLRSKIKSKLLCHMTFLPKCTILRVFPPANYQIFVMVCTYSICQLVFLVDWNLWPCPNICCRHLLTLISKTWQIHPNFFGI